MKAIISLFLVFVALYCAGQNKIIYRESHSLFMLDIDTRKGYVLDSALYHNDRLAGIKMTRDSVVCYYSRLEKVDTRSYDLSYIENLKIKSSLEFTYGVKMNSFYRHNFYFKDYRFVNYSDGVSLLKSGKILWSSSKKTRFNGGLDKEYYLKASNRLGPAPVISPDEKYLLYISFHYGFLTNSAKLYEVEIDTGKKYLISKRGHDYFPSYSADGRYILFAAGPLGEFMVYDTRTRKNVFIYSFQDAFWVCQRDL